MTKEEKDKQYWKEYYQRNKEILKANVKKWRAKKKKKI